MAITRPDAARVHRQKLVRTIHRTRHRRRRRRLSLEQLEQRALLATIVWDGEAGDKRWETPGNWFDLTNNLNNVLPSTDDVVRLPSGANIQLGRDVDIQSLDIEAGASLLLGVDGSEADNRTTLNADISLRGILTTRRDVVIQGAVDVVSQGQFRVEAWSAISSAGIVFPGSASVLVQGDVQNDGLVQLISRDIDAGHPCCGGSRATLEIDKGFRLDNSGTLRADMPPHGKRLDDILYGLYGEIANHGAVELNFDLAAQNGAWTNAGSIDVNTYQISGTTRKVDFDLTDGTLIHDGGRVTGDGQLTLVRSTVQLAQDWDLDATAPDLFTVDTTFEPAAGATASRLTIAEGEDLLLFRSQVTTPVHLAGSLRVRGDVSLSGGFSTSSTSDILLDPFGLIYHPSPQQGDAVLQVHGDWSNEGTIRFRGRDVVRIHPIDVGDDLRLELIGGRMENRGTIRALEPTLDRTYQYGIDGNWDNVGSFLLDFPFKLTGATDATFGGTITFGSYTNAGEQLIPTLTLENSHHIYRTTDISGGGTLQVIQATLQLDDPLRYDRAAFTMLLDRATITGPEAFTVAESGPLLFFSTHVAAPLLLEGSGVFRGSSRISGPLTIAPTGTLDVRAYRNTNDFYNAYPFTGDSLLDIDSSFTNQGVIQLWSQEGYGTQYAGSTAWITLPQGAVLTNEGTLRTRAPTGSDQGTSLRIRGAIDNHGNLIVEGRSLHVEEAMSLSSGQMMIGDGVQLYAGSGVQQTAGTLGLEKGELFIPFPFSLQVDGGNVTGSGTLNVSSTSISGTLAPGFDPPLSDGTKIGTLSFLGNLSQQASGRLELDIDGLEAGEFDRVSVSSQFTPSGTLALRTDPQIAAPLGSSISPVTFGSGTAAQFQNVQGQQINFTSAWGVDYGTTSIPLHVMEVSEATQAELLREAFNAGVLESRARLPAWFDAAHLGLPGSQQRPGTVFEGLLDAFASAILPMAGTPVTSLSELKSQLSSLGYTDVCILGEANCDTEFLKVGVADAALQGTASTTTAADSFATLSLIPTGVELLGTLDWNATAAVVDLGFGVDASGFYLDEVSSLSLEVSGGGSVRHEDFPLPQGGMQLEFDGDVSVTDTLPIATAISPQSKLRVSGFAADPRTVFDIQSSGESRLTIVHTIEPGGLSYDGTWLFNQDCSGDACTLQEISGVVEYPTIDDWLGTTLEVFATAMQALLGGETAQNFGSISLPLIPDMLAASAAPGLFGINPVHLGPPASWMDSALGAVNRLFTDAKSRTKEQFPSGRALIGVDDLRENGGVDGTGIKVGVISTGSDGLAFAQASGAVPAILPTLLHEKGSGGTGTAMLEVLHELAPGAELALASATDQDSLFTAIAWLIDVQNVDVIVADVVDYTAPMFAVGGLPAYVQDKIEQRDVLFIQAAGNDGQRSYRDVLDLVNQDDGSGGTRTLHRFSGTIENPVTTLPVSVAAHSAVRFVLQTSQSLSAPTGRVVAQVKALPNGVLVDRLGFPLEGTSGRDPEIPLTVDSFSVANHTGEEITIELMVEVIGGQIPQDTDTEFQLVALGDAMLSEARGPALFGPALLDEVLVVGATEITQLQGAAPFSSAGSATGRRPDVVTPATISIPAFGLGFLGAFGGTSSSAAQVGAVAALLRELEPSSTASEIREALKSTATPIGSGSGDPRSGHGLIDALEAAQIFLPGEEEPGPGSEPGENVFLEYLGELPQVVGLQLLTQQQFEQILRGAPVQVDDLLQLEVAVSGDGLGTFGAEFPFDFGGIGGFDQFDISGKLGMAARPDVQMLLGWDDGGWYLDVQGSRLAVRLNGTGSARGEALQVFGIGAGASVTATPYLDLPALDRAGEGRIRQDDLEQLLDDFSNGDISRVVPKLDAVHADLYGDVILGFLDYVDIDPSLPNRANGGDPFIIRGTAKLEVDVEQLANGFIDAWAFSDFALANPDIDGDERPDYTLGALARNAVLFGEQLINAIEVPAFLKELLGGVGLDGEPLRGDPLTRPRGMLPDEIPETAEAMAARLAINAHIVQAIGQASGGEIDQNLLAENIRDELLVWLAGIEDDGSSEGEPGQLSVLEQLDVLQRDITRPQVDLADTPQDEFEESLVRAIGSYQRWISALSIAGFEREDVADAQTLATLDSRLIGALRHAIERSHVGAIELHLAGAPLNHQYETSEQNGQQVQTVVQRGVIDRALDAVAWAQTAEFLQLATAENGLSVARAIEDLVITVDLQRAELRFADEDRPDPYLGPGEEVLFEVEAGWKIKLPPSGVQPSIDDLATYSFGSTLPDAGGNLIIQSAGAANNNAIAGDRIVIDLDPVTGLPRKGQRDLLPITRGAFDASGLYRTAVRLGEGDTQAQIQIDVGFKSFGILNTKTNVIHGRPHLELLGAIGNEDDSALRKDNLLVAPGGVVALQARIRRGNGPLADAPLNFYLSGSGSLDQVQVTTSRNIPRTSRDGVATIFYSAPLDSVDVATIGVVYFDGGEMFRDTIEIGTIDQPELLGQIRNPIQNQAPSSQQEAVDTRDAFQSALADTAADQLPPEVMNGLQQLVDAWLAAVSTKIASALAETSQIADNPNQVDSTVAEAAAAYFEWLAHAQLIEAQLTPDQTAAENNLLAAFQAMASYWLGRFDGTANRGGLVPLYQALGWSAALENLLALRPSLLVDGTLTSEAVLAQSGIGIELLPPTSAVTAARPRLIGTTDEATLQVSARVVRRGPGGQVTPVMQTADLPAPVEVRLLPLGLADVRVVDTAGGALAAQSGNERLDRKGYIGSQYELSESSEEYELVAAPAVLTATARRGASENELGINVGLGIPGLLLETHTVSMLDAPHLTLRGALDTEDDSALRKNLNLPAGGQAVLQVELLRNELPLRGDVELTLVGPGVLSTTAGNTGSAGVLGGIVFTPPITPPASGVTEGVSLVNVRHVQQGRVYTDTLVIAFQYGDPNGQDGLPLGTPDFVRASARLELALRNVTSIDPHTGLVEVDHEAFQQAAVDIVRDWWLGDPDLPASEGSVLYWLEQVQAPAEGGAFPIDTDWEEVPADRDGDFRQGLRDAIENWYRWQAVVEYLGVAHVEVIPAAEHEQAKQLIVSALEHAIERVQARCQARVPEYLAEPDTSPQKAELLARLIIEGDQALEDFGALQILSEFDGFPAANRVEFDSLLSQLCYSVEIVDGETYLDGSPQNATVRVKAGIRVEGVADLLLPPPTAPLVVAVNPVGNARLDGIGLGRTDEQGVYDRVQASIGSGDEQLAVDVSVVFRFDNLNDPAALVRAQSLTYVTKRVVLDTTERLSTTWAPESDGPSSLSQRPRTVVDGQRVLVETVLSKGRTPVIGKPVYITLLGEGLLDSGLHLTDNAGRVRLYYTPPPKQVGRAQIVVAYQKDGETITDTIAIDYTTTSGTNEIDVPYSEAQAIAAGQAGLHLAQVGTLTLFGASPQLDFELLETIQRSWLDSGMNPDGTIDDQQPCGVRCYIQQASDAPPETQARLTLVAAREYLRWSGTNAAVDLEDRFTAPADLAVRDSLVQLFQDTIDAGIDAALNQRSASLAQAILQLAAEAETTDFLDQGQPGYSFPEVIARLGYEIRIDEARLHGEADDAWVQIVVRVYLKDASNPGGPKVRADRDTPITVEVFPLGFRLVNATKTVDNGLYGAKAYLVEGDSDLQLVIRASDAFAETEMLTLQQPGKFSFDVGVRREDDPDASLASSLTIGAGQQARIEGIVQKGLGRVGFRDVLFAVEGAPVDSVTRVEGRSDAFVFTPPAGQTGTATITLSLQADGRLFQETVQIEFSDQIPPEPEPGSSPPAAAGSGLLNNQHTVAAFNEASIPLAADSDGAKLGNAFGLDAFQFPFSGGLPSGGEFRRDLGNWFSNSFDLLHIVDLETIVGMLNGGLPAQPEELLRIKFDLQNATASVPPTLFAADFSGLLPDGFEGSVRLDRPEISGQIVFGIDTSSSPFYVLTKPDRLTSNQASVDDLLNGGADRAVRAGREATELSARFGVAATFSSSQDLIDGILAVPHAEGYLSSKLKLDFSRVAADTGKLRFTQLGELANLRVGFDGNPIDSFQAIAAAEVTLPDLGGASSNGNSLANIEVVGAIHKPPPADEAQQADAPWQFQLRTGRLFELTDQLRQRLSNATVDRASTPEADRDDPYEDNDDWTKVTVNHAADLGAPIGRRTIGGADPAVSDNVLALADAADWFRFQTMEPGDATNFVRIDFDGQRGDLDFELYRLAGEQLVHVRTDGLAFGNSAQLTLLGQPAGTYFVKVFDDGGARNPYYALTIDPPGTVQPGIEAAIGDFSIRDTALEINVDSNLEFSGQLSGRMVMLFGEQNDVPVELAFRAAIDTNANDPNDNGGLFAQISTALGGNSISTLALRDSAGSEIPPPTYGAWSATIDPQLGGYMIFDYVSVDDFKFAGLDAAANRWVMGSYDAEGGWVVPDNSSYRRAAVTDNHPAIRMQLVFSGNTAELWVGEGETAEKMLSGQFSEDLDGGLGIGTPLGQAHFDDVVLKASPATASTSEANSGLPTFQSTLFGDTFAPSASDRWQVQRGIWRVDDNEQYVARATSIELGDWLLIDSAEIVGRIDVQFSDDNILAAPPVVVDVCDASVGSDGCVAASIELTNVNALLFQVDENDQGTLLYPEQDGSPKGLIAIRDAFLSINPMGARLGAGSVTAGLQDVLFVTVDGATIDLTADANEPLFAASDISILAPALSEDSDFVTISGNTPGDRLFGLSKPTLGDPIPEFLLFQDGITIDFDTALIQKKIDINGVFPFTLESVGLRFNDAGDESGRIGNLADFDLLVQGQIDFQNSIFDGLPFDPIFAVGQPELTNTAGQERRVSDPAAYSDTCSSPIDANQFPGFGPLCQNGFVSAELHLGALLGDQPNLLIRNLGPIYIGFADLSLFGSDPTVDGSLTINGLVELGGFEEGTFVPDIRGSLSVVGKGRAGDPPEGTTLGALTVAGQFTPVQVDNQGTADPLDDEYKTSLILDWYGEASGSIGDRFNVSVQNAAVNIHTEFINTITATTPFDLTALIEPRVIDTGNLCIELGAYVQLCGSGVLNPSAEEDEPFVIVREGSLLFGEELGPLKDVTVSAGGFGLGADGTIYVLPAGYEILDPQDPNVVLASFPDGAFVEVHNDQPGGLFGLPEWVPISVRGIGVQFAGVADPDDPDAPMQPLTVGPPTQDELAGVVGDVPRGVASLGGRVISDLVPLTDPGNLKLVISGGLEGNEMFPVTGNFERLQVNLGKLAGCVAVAAQTHGIDLVNSHAGYIFDSPCEFPIEGLDGFVVGIEPMDLGPLSIGGALGLGVFTFERPIDPDDPNSPTEPQNVFYGKIEGEFTAAKIGLGVELIFTQYGPVLGRLTAGVPIPIGTLVGSLGGPIGAAFGTGSGFLITGLQGGLVFDADPLPVVHEPTDIFTTPKLRTPLEISTADIQNAVRDLAMQNPTFSELIAAATDPNNLPLFGQNQTFAETIIDILQGRIPGLPVKFTWDDGFRAVVSGTLTNQYVSAQVGLGVTLGLNVGYNFEALLPDPGNPDAELPEPLPPNFPVHPNGAPAMDAQGFALDANGNRLDAEGNPVAEGVTQGLATFGDAFGFQLYGFADVEVFGFKLVGAGALLDFTDPINPVFNVAAGLPTAPGLLSLLLPAQGVIGAQLDFDGYVEGSILATLALLESVRDDTSSFFHDVLGSVDAELPLGMPSPLKTLADSLEADRRFAAGVDLGDPDDPGYDARFDPRLSGYDPSGPGNLTPDLWQLVLDVDASGVVEPGEVQEITRGLLIDRILGDATAPVPSMMPDPLTADFGQLDVLSLSRVVNHFTQEMLIVAPTLLADQQAAEALTADVPFWESIEAQMDAVHQGLLLTVDDPQQRSRLQAAYEASLTQARVGAAFSYRIAEAAYNAGNAAAERFAEVINPTLRITGQLSPMLLGIPMGPPSQSVDVTVSKHELTLRGEFSSLALLLNMNALPAFVNDRSTVDVHFPFENLLADMYKLQLPVIDPLAEDWRGSMASSMNVLGLEVQRSEAIVFPAGAEQLLVSGDNPKLQIYDPEVPDSIEPGKILVRIDHLPRLLQQGGLLFDGRLTLPRFITDPLALWSDLQNDPELQQQIEAFATDCEDLWSCIAAHPAETFGLLSRLPDVLGNATSLEEVAQVQLFVPNFVDDVIASFDQETLEELNQLRDPQTATNGDALVALITREVTQAAAVSNSVLQDAYLVGSYGQWPEPFNHEPFQPVIPDPEDPASPPPFPTTSKVLGIELGSGRLAGEVTSTGFDLDLVGKFLGLADVRFEANLNTSTGDTFGDTNGNGVFDFAEPLNPFADRAPVGVYNAAENWNDVNGNGVIDPGEHIDLDGNGVYDPHGDEFIDLNFNGEWDAGDSFLTAKDGGGEWVMTEHDRNANGTYDPALLRLGAEFVLGDAPDACTISPSAWQGAQDAQQVADQLLDFLGQVGLAERDDSLPGALGPTFPWLNLDNFGAEAGACLRAFSPGFDPTSSDPLRWTGGIEAHATVGIDNLLDGVFEFQIRPSGNPIPDVVARGAASQVLLPGLEGLTPGGINNATLASALVVEFVHENGQLSAALTGTLTLLGQEFALSGDTSLSVYNNGIAGEIALTKDGPLVNPLFEINGDFALRFDTRPSSLSAGIVVENGTLVLPGFSLTDASFSITVDAAGVHVQDVQGHSDLFDVLTLDFAGGFSITPDRVLQNIDLTSSTMVDATIGPGDVHGEADIVVDSTGIHGSFSGYGTVFGVPLGDENNPVLEGTFDFAGCLALTEPVEAHFQLPGTGAVCGEAQGTSLAFRLGDDIKILEGNGDGLKTISLQVTAEMFGTTGAFKISVPWNAQSQGASAGSDFILPATRRLEFTENQLTATISLDIRSDDQFEERESFVIVIDEQAITLDSGGEVTWFVARGEATVEILNDDEPDYSPLYPRPDTLVHFDFDLPRNFAPPLFERQSEPELAGIAPLLTEFEQSQIRPPQSAPLSLIPGLFSRLIRRGLASKAGLPVTITEEDGNIAEVDSQAVYVAAGFHQPSIEFTVDPKNGNWLPQGIDFFTSDAPEAQHWELRWDIDNYAEPIMTSSGPGASTFAYGQLAPGWTRHRYEIGSFVPGARTPVQGLLCSEGPITFRLINTSDQASGWTVDNLSLLGEVGGTSCLAELDNSIDEIEDFLNQQDGLIPGPIEILGPGHPIIRILPDSGDIDPDPYDVIDIEITGTSPESTIIRIGAGGSNPPLSQLARVNVRTDSGVLAVDLTGVDTFRGSVTINGTVSDGIDVASLADGSSITVHNEFGAPVDIHVEGSLGDDVDISVTGDIGELNLGGPWLGGLLQAGSVAEFSVGGDLVADVALQQGLGTLQILGGDLLSETFATGLAQAPNDGSVESIEVVAVGGIGGSIESSISIDGDVNEILTSGGSLDSEIVAGVIGSIISVVDTTTSAGGGIAGTIDATSIDLISSTGGDVTASVVTHNPLHQTMKATAKPVGGRGGKIISPNSFHIAGGVSTIIGNQIQLRIEAGAAIGRISAIDDGPLRPGSLQGRFTAHRFGEISTSPNAQADFELTVLAEAWELDGEPAFLEIRVPHGSDEWLAEQIHLPPGVTAGAIVFVGEELPAYRNPANRYDVDANGVVNARDVRTLITYLITSGSGTPTENGPPYLDVTAPDDIVNVRDVRALLEFIIRGEGEPADELAAARFSDTGGTAGEARRALAPSAVPFDLLRRLPSTTTDVREYVFALPSEEDSDLDDLIDSILEL